MKIDSATIEEMRQGLLGAISERDKLGQLDDVVAGVLKEIEDKLLALELGYRISTHQVVADGSFQLEERLEYCKWGGSWRLVYSETIVEVQDFNEKALLDWDRDTRARALSVLVPKLILEVGSSLQARITERNEAIATGKKLADLLQNVQDIPF